jgi:conjugal transfer pilus assembly protein TraF
VLSLNTAATVNDDEKQPERPVVKNHGFYGDRERGYFWYEDPAEVTKKEKPDAENGMKFMLETDPEKDPIKALEEYQEQIKKAEAKALLNPTYENVKRFMELNRQNLDRASYYSDVWRRIVWANPDLDYSRVRPSNASANIRYKDIKKVKKSQAVYDIAKTHGIFFFFKGTCDFCHAFAPTLKMFEKKYGLNIMAVSLDGGTLPEYPNPRVDTTVAQKLGVTSVPSIYLFNTKTKQVIPVANTMISLSELEDRIYVLTKTKPGEDY